MPVIEYADDTWMGLCDAASALMRRVCRDAPPRRGLGNSFLEELRLPHPYLSERPFDGIVVHYGAAWPAARVVSLATEAVAVVALAALAITEIPVTEGPGGGPRRPTDHDREVVALAAALHAYGLVETDREGP